MTQLELPLFDIEPIEAGEIAAVEAAVRSAPRGLHDRSARAGRPRPCRCARPWTLQSFDGPRCGKCGRTQQEGRTR
jgi:hypothetical protein